ncbi:MAG: ATP-binding protein [Candidatus Thorarchaeota archaeon]|nr:ATP-binding protein [Candidatus Thorarchaeota archaeon]
MNTHENIPETLFTDFDGIFDGTLARVVTVPANYTSEWAGSAARYECKIKVRYNKELMSLLEEGMMLAVPNFRGVSKKSVKDNIQRFTVMVISKVWPQHYGLKGVSDSHYFPLQFEVTEQAVDDWDTDDQTTMLVEMSAIPINQDLVVLPDGTIEFRKGFSYPLVGSKVHVLSMETIDYVYNARVREALGVKTGKTVSNPRKDPRVGVLRMFQESDVEIPIYVDLEKLVRYHFGIFSFTGGGKSNLLSNLFRRILYHSPDTKLVIFDISCEYPFLLSDVLLDPKISSSVILEQEATSGADFARSIVKPRDFEDDPRASKVLESVFDRGVVTFYSPPSTQIPTYGAILSEIRTLRNGSLDRPNYVQAMDDILYSVVGWMGSWGKNEGDMIDDDFVDHLSKASMDAMAKFKVNERATIHAWASTRDSLKISIQRAQGAVQKGVTTTEILKMLGGDERLIIISIADPDTLRELVIRLTSASLKYRKKTFEIKPHILFVFDEAQEFIPSRASGLLDDCSRAVERLLRQGRKYGLGGAIATQRIAYLNTNILQQLHTFFVGTLPRPYDRTVVSSSFQIDLSILDKTLEFPPGSWLLSSYIATGLDNVPIFVKADNSEDVLRSHVEKYS